MSRLNQQPEIGDVRPLKYPPLDHQIREERHNKDQHNGCRYDVPGAAEMQTHSVMALVSTSMKPEPRKKNGM